MSVFFIVFLPLLVFGFVGWGIWGLVADKLQLKPPGMLLATGYAISNVLYFAFYFLFGGTYPALAAIVCIAGVLNVVHFIRLKRRKIPVFASLLPNIRAEALAYGLFVGVIAFSAATYVSSGVGRYWHTANEDVFDGLFGRNAYLSGALAGNPQALDAVSRTRSEAQNTLNERAGLSPIISAEFFHSRYVQDPGALQYSSLALISTIIDITSGMDAFVVQALLNLGLFALGVYAFVRHIFGQSARISGLSAAMSAVGNFYLATYFNGHIGSLMYNAVIPFVFMYAAKWIRDHDAPGAWLLIPASFLAFVLGAYPFPLPYVVAPLITYAALQWHCQRTSSGSIFLLADNRRVLLLVCSLLLLAFVCSYYLAEPLRFRAMNQFRSWGTSINYVGFLQFWGIWFSGLTYTASPLGWLISQPATVIASIVLAIVLSLVAMYGFYVLLKQRVEFVLIWLPFAILFFFVMRFSVYDSYYFYKFLYINAWIVVSATVIGIATCFRRFQKILGFALMGIVAVWISVNLLNNVLAIWLVSDKKFNTNAGEYQKVLEAPVSVLNETFVAIPQRDHADLVMQIFGEHGIKTRKIKRDAKYLLHQVGVPDVTYEPIGEIIWRSSLFVIAKKPDRDVVELSSFWSPEGGDSGADRTRQQVSLGVYWAIKLTGLGMSYSPLFRWVTDRRNSAVLIDVSRRTDNSKYLYLCGESGPGVGFRPVKVHVTDADRQVVGDMQVGAYACQWLNVADFKSPFLLDHNEVGEYSSSLDRRKLVYRIMGIGFSSSESVENLPANLVNVKDIFSIRDVRKGVPDIKMRLGRNWYEYETFAKESFRWVNGGAEIILRAGKDNAGTLSAIVETGPSSGNGHVVLSLLDYQNNLVGTCHVYGRTECKFLFNNIPNSDSVFRFVSNGAGLPLASDPRRLNFRVFDLSWRN